MGYPTNQNILLVAQRVLNRLQMNQPTRVFDQMLVQTDLLVGLGIHEVVPLVVVVQEGVLAGFDAHRIDFVTGIERVVHHLSSLDVLQFGPNEGCTFSRFDVKKLDDLPQPIVVVQYHAVFDVACVGH